MFYVYIIKSKINNSFYIGQTENLLERLKRHNEGRSVYTKNKKPWELVYFEEYKTRIQAIRRERKLKKLKSRRQLEKLIAHSD